MSLCVGKMGGKCLEIWDIFFPQYFFSSEVHLPVKRGLSGSSPIKTNKGGQRGTKTKTNGEGQIYGWWRPVAPGGGKVRPLVGGRSAIVIKK